MAANQNADNWVPQKPSAQPLKRYWEIIEDIVKTVPQSEWEKVPHDGSINYRHYLYGHPKVEEP